MTTRPQTENGHNSVGLYVAAAIIAGIAHLGVGYLYVISGLAIPLLVVVVGLAWWVVLAVLGVLLVRRRSYLALLVPVVALVTWLGVLWFGGTALGWTA